MKFLSLGDTSVTTQGIARLQQALPTTHPPVGRAVWHRLFAQGRRMIDPVIQRL
jgi:hypothetical protein